MPSTNCSIERVDVIQRGYNSRDRVWSHFQGGQHKSGRTEAGCPPSQKPGGGEGMVDFRNYRFVQDLAGVNGIVEIGFVHGSDLDPTSKERELVPPVN